MNFVAGRLSEAVGRRVVLIAGWVIALPVPVMIWAAPSWGGRGGDGASGRQSGDDLVDDADHEAGPCRGGGTGARGRDQRIRGLWRGGAGGIATGWAATAMGARLGLLVVGLAVVGAALVMALTAVRETRAGAPLARRHGDGRGLCADDMGDRRLAALSQAGWSRSSSMRWSGSCCRWLFARGLSLTQIGWVTGTYGMVWGVAQLWTGGCRTGWGGTGRTWAACGSAARRGDVPWRGHGVVDGGVGGDGDGNGAAVSEPVGGGGGYCAARVAGVGHRDLPVLAGYWLRGGRAGAGPRAGAPRPRLLARGGDGLSGAVLAMWGEETRPGKGA